MLSGIGDGNDLKKLRIPVVSNLPGVGPELARPFGIVVDAGELYLYGYQSVSIVTAIKYVLQTVKNITILNLLNPIFFWYHCRPARSQ